MPSPVKTGLFPAAATTARPSTNAAPDSGEAFREELVRRSRAEGKKDRAGEPAPDPKRAEKKGAKATRQKGRAANEDASPADPATDAPPGADAPATPQGTTEAERSSGADAESDAEAEGADAVRDEAEGDEVNGNPAAAAAASATVSVAANADGETSESATTQRAASEHPSVYHAGATGTEPGALPDGNAAHGSATQDAIPGLFDSTDDTPTENPPARAAASAAVSEADPATGGAGAVADATAEAPSAPASTDTASSPSSVTAHFSDGDFQVPNAPHRPRSDAPPTPTTTTPPEVRFAQDNHANIVTSMRGELLPGGGSMRIRLDPPQLGALQVTVQIRDGLVTAAFETSSDEATRLLGHSLNHLKSVLESQGVAVDKLQVQQAPREAQAQTSGDDARREQGGQSQEQEQSARQEQQRREMLRRMWRRLAGGQDPLDLTA